MVLQAEPTEQLDMQGTVLLSHLLTIVAFKLDTSHSFIVASCVIESGLEVEAFRETRCGCSSLGGRVRVDRIGRDCELEISKILLMVEPRGYLRFCSWWTPRGGGIASSQVWVHGDIASSRVWVHGIDIHHSW